VQFDRSLFLEGESAFGIFREIENLPVYDIHTHVDLGFVLRNEPPPDPWTALCAGDHYISSMVETLGTMDRATFYSPATDPFDKWQAYAAAFPLLLGNPVRDWMRMALADLGIDTPFEPGTARALWEPLSVTLRDDRYRPVNLFKRSPIVRISTTDNPVDSLRAIQQAESVFGKEYWTPTWRPDAFLNLAPSPIAPRTWLDWVEELERVAGQSVKGRFDEFLQALATRHDFFATHGCRASDYGVAVPAGHDVPQARAEFVFDKACRRQKLAPDEIFDFQAFLMRFSMDLDFEKGWLSQIHYGPARNQRRVASESGGLDSGCDTINGYPDVVHSLHDLLNHFDTTGKRHHRILIYALSMNDWEKIAGLSRIYPSVFSGMAWWYFDSVSGMTEFFSKIPDMGAGFLKMGPFVTDARNIYSLGPRTQMYRRCLATALGRLADARGENRDDVTALARRLCTDHPRTLLGLE